MKLRFNTWIKQHVTFNDWVLCYYNNYKTHKVLIQWSFIVFSTFSNRAAPVSRVNNRRWRRRCLATTRRPLPQIKAPLWSHSELQGQTRSFQVKWNHNFLLMRRLQVGENMLKIKLTMFQSLIFKHDPKSAPYIDSVNHQDFSGVPLNQ